MYEQFYKKFNTMLFAALFFWALFFFIYGGYQKIERFSVASELCLDAIILMTSWKLASKTNKENKIYFYLFFCSFFGVLVSNANYALVFLILKKIVPTSFDSVLYMMPYAFFLILQIIFWFKIASNFIIKTRSNFWMPLPFFLTSMIVFTIYLVASLILVKHFTSITGFQFMLGAMDLILSNLVILALMVSRNRGLYLIALGLSMVVATNFWWMYLYHNQALGIADYSASFWLLALILIAFGVTYLFRTQEFNMRPWFGLFSGIRSQVILWTFSLAILSVLTLFFIGYSFNVINISIIQSIPFLIMIYSVFVIFISNFLGSRFEKPFKQIEYGIDGLMNRKKNILPSKHSFYIDEFSFLQKFITDTFRLYEEKNKEKKKITDLAIQVAHDIRSPVSAIWMLSKDSVELPEERRNAFREAANRIQDIAHHLLSCYGSKKSNAEDSEFKVSLVSKSALSVLSEKRMQFKNSKISFLYDATDESNFIFIKMQRVEFERMLSNLLNNAVESIANSGTVKIILTQEDENLIIKISDTGKGMSQKFIEQAMSHDKILSNKTIGYGLGLTHAMSVLKKHGATLNINSVINVGTHIAMAFPITNRPLWIINEIVFSQDDHILILDDDSFIHGAWDNLFSIHTKKNKNLKITHFTKAEDCLRYIKNLSEKNKFLLLTDYELIKQNMNGLDVIKNGGVKRSILVTSHDEEVDVVKKTILFQSKLLPKMLVSSVKLTMESNEKSDDEKSDKNTDILVLEDKKELGDILIYLYRDKGKFLKVYNTPYDLLENIERYPQKIKIVLDYDLNCPVTGVDVAAVLYSRGYENLYLATGFLMEEIQLPSYLHILKDKMDLTDLFAEEESPSIY